MKIADIRADFPARFQFENELKTAGFPIVAGIDEVGRGCVAGPVIACACILPADFSLAETFDSKSLTKTRRLAIEAELKKSVLDFAFGEVSAAEIDRINIYQAARQAMKKAVLALHTEPSALVIDAMSVDLPLKQVKIIHGDRLSNSIAAASILAKGHRDRIMAKMAEKYPGYGFERNVGYLTKEGKKALLEYGITPIHRKSFAPVSNLLK
ncbi:ribonuclease HII [Oenococcus kitaharae]|uniref:Ribonuclease HII n=1 Tax=Oenococcus kitaharae DSM 17330 TaxID=1045004 RepID=G9WH21_9LACO|nr:ribonuclease HII [Oenococcus kitaharae]EHN59510.1 Ribonuclease HII [Oenococcus kitaharae DSM 17330]OEY83366.1 RNase HII [Oenococcus kitaharae]OEY85165.1 RNase HII [Oenococcus kitaharae]OEY86020.1 RNase HII [Oenococcus kitaharae]